ncbi:putative membrane protein [Candidatus Erwinia dacicola]|uniref:Membrane protein n=1 Tax=Candidatus Erwinia dacicola TaxID=252393 RepID=A0A328TLR2_9GAMM|nr:putative membrane protein [Candidatus Erwinia dacicola]
MLWMVLPLTGALLLSICGSWLGIRLLRGKALFREYYAE